MLDGMQADRPVSVGELTRSIRGILESTLPFVRVVGEISNLRQPLSGHFYFTLKDEEAQLRAVFFKMQQRYSTVKLTDGKQVICRGRISVYEARGEYQLIVDAVEEYGLGRLTMQFEELKRRLADEGLFDPETKKTLPVLPRRIALVTSPSGAAVHDFLQTAAALFPGFPILVVPVRVQGQGAAAEIIEALQLVERKKLADVVVLCRGGGSIEDLWEFNDETLARTIHRLSIPVVTGIGHEIDFTIADFVADLRAVTPTAAAEAVVPDRAGLLDLIDRHRTSLTRSMGKMLSERERLLASASRQIREPRMLANLMLRVDNLQERQIRSMYFLLQRRESELARLLQRLNARQPFELLGNDAQRLSALRRRISTAMLVSLQRRDEGLNGAVAHLKAVSPESILKRGYALVTTMGNKVVSDAADTSTGQSLRVRLYKGKLKVRVLEAEGGE